MTHFPSFQWPASSPLTPAQAGGIAAVAPNNAYYPTPYVIERTGRGEQSYDIYSRLLKDRIIFLGTAIDDQVANAVIAPAFVPPDGGPEEGTFTSTSTRPAAA